MGGKNDMQKKSVILTGTDHLEKAMFFKKQCLERAELEKCICKKLPSQIFRECRVLNEVDLPKDLEIIGNEAFFKCRQLEYIDLPIGLKKIGKKAFYFSGIKKVSFPKNLEIIGEAAYQKSRLTGGVQIPAGVNYVGNFAFSGIESLKEILFLGDPEFIGAHMINKNVLVKCRAGSRMARYCEANNLRAEYIA